MGLSVIFALYETAKSIGGNGRGFGNSMLEVRAMGALDQLQRYQPVVWACLHINKWVGGMRSLIYETEISFINCFLLLLM